MAEQVDISVIIPTWRRLDKLKICIENIEQCNPCPREILIHVDANDDSTTEYLKQYKSTWLRWSQSQETRGPGGGRNWLIANATCELLCGLDDDSWPIDNDFLTKQKP
ncbi:glycosyltransferase family 2 protein [Fontisphaera persica]|uniref:glycosyltransferase family 2 protein n=1 Tax=Fontisphaera persica TaxID=2974023 RepID=UPI003CCDBF4E